MGNSNDFSETHEVENETSHFFFDGIEKTQLFFGNGNFEDVMVRIFLWKSPMMDGLVSLLRHEHQSREIFSVGWKGRCSFCSENTTLSFTHVFCQQDRFQEFSDWGIIISLNVEDCMLGIFFTSCRRRRMLQVQFEVLLCMVHAFAFLVFEHEPPKNCSCYKT